MIARAAAFLFLAACAITDAAAQDRPTSLQGPILPGLGPAARRTAVDIDAAPWRGVVRVQTELGERCTGFLLAPDLVATAGHCLYLPKVRRFIAPADIHVLLGVDLDRFRAHARVARFIVPPGYDPARESRTMRLDRAFLTLGRTLGTAASRLPIASVMPPPGSAIAVGGYGQDREEKLVADLHCHLLGTVDGIIHHDCAGTRGSSGAPLLWQDATGTWRVLGIEVAANVAGVGGLAVSLVPNQ